MSTLALSETREETGFGARLFEFMVVGGATLVLYPLAWLLRSALGLDASELTVGFLTFYGAYVINDPHFAVTYVLFYKDVRKRVTNARWLVAGVLVPIALVAWAIAGLALRSAQTLGWMIQLMFLLVGWHYVKQGFGVLAVLAARRGVRVTDRERKVFLFHCYAGWAFAWANPAAPAGEFEEKGVVYRALAHPRWLEIGAGAVLAASAIALAAVMIERWRRERRLLPLAPTSGLLITVWSWTIFSSLDPLVRYVIPALHSVQYLYFVWLMKRTEARAEEGPPTFGRPVAVRLGILALTALGLGWLLFHGAPAYLDGALLPPSRGGTMTDALGETPFFACFFVVVSIHHYFMDHVVWRRDNPDTRWLREAAP
ncbi:MAG: hypothetical protein KF819_17810 [Labilithrix sp.]|nr:hypothetical protein [Labilithrix sp.]